MWIFRGKTSPAYDPILPRVGLEFGSSEEITCGKESDRLQASSNSFSTRSAADDSTASLRFYHTAFWVLLVICLVQGLANAFLAVKYTQDRQAWVESPVPPIPWTLRTFARNLSMANLTTSREVEVAWQDYETTAFVHIPNPQAYSLRPNKGVVPGTQNIYMLSAYHQLHCLKMLHLSFVHLAFERSEAAEVGGQAQYEVRHVEHCFDYLRQGLTCAGDSTLEGPDPGMASLTGYGVTHRCRAWDEGGGLDRWREMHQM
ncbi:hypothetical protein B0T22DRAFT_460245 [Podospora appendiculata]|uniref:Oxidase ustYa n=1 Tax=Podospora appendiculata TaxID=314037 RepID=A0AAE0X9Y6_9PEZI|nr:hypothetical protein B0T22DRAFT_460245 [Podospora appendiculata]